MLRSGLFSTKSDIDEGELNSVANAYLWDRNRSCVREIAVGIVERFARCETTGVSPVYMRINLLLISGLSEHHFAGIVCFDRFWVGCSPSGTDSR
jgi:hypothetical protein